MSTFRFSRHLAFAAAASASALSTTLIAAGASATTFKVDPAHSAIDFTVKHMMISTVTGHFRDFSGDFSFDPKSGDLTGAGDFVAKTESIDTGVAKRDGHLKSPDFFDAAKCPTLTISKSKIKKTGAKSYEWTGDLTMHCVTKPITFAVEYVGSIKGPEGATHAGFNAKSKINRKDWGLSWNKAVEAGGVMVGEEVAVEISVEAVEETAKK